jgi:hypothetical protein
MPDDDEIVHRLISMEHRDFVETLRKVFKVKRPSDNDNDCISRYFLGTAVAFPDPMKDEPGSWENYILEACAYIDRDSYSVPDFMGPVGEFCESGHCRSCNTPVTSWGRHSNSAAGGGRKCGTMTLE